MRTVDPVKHEAKRRHILDTAAGCFARNGLERTTIAQICTAAGISSGSLFHYFSNKRAIFTAIFEQDRRDTADRLATAAESDDPWGAVLGLVDFLVAPLAEPEVSGLVTELMAQAGRDDALATLVERNDRAMRDAVAALLQRAAAQGQIDDTLDSTMVATWITGLVDTLFTKATIDRDFAPLEQVPTLHLMLTRFLHADPR